MTPSSLYHGRRLTVAQRAACHQFGETRLDGRPAPSVTTFARLIGCHRDTVYRWMARPDPLGIPPGPARGTLRRPLAEGPAGDALHWRTAGLALPDVAAALRDDYPELAITNHSVAVYSKREQWPPLVPPPPLRRTQPFVNAPAGFLHLDLIIGPRPGSDPVILTARERHSRWFDALPLASKHASVVVAGLAVILDRLPIPITVVLTDRGSEFMGGMDAFLAERGIEHRRTRPYTPQTNGMIERANGLLKQYGPLKDPQWWHIHPGEAATEADEWYPERATERRLPRMETSLQRWSHWRNLVRPNRQLGGLTPLAWCQVHPDRCRESVLNAMLKGLAHRERAAGNTRTATPPCAPSVVVPS